MYFPFPLSKGEGVKKYILNKLLVYYLYDITYY